MKERPILFSGPMVRAILEGRKTQTRRVVKPSKYQMEWMKDGVLEKLTAKMKERGVQFYMEPDKLNPFGFIKCPYGTPGDRLWVRETFAIYGDEQKYVAHYRADRDDWPPQCGWSPSIHMPRWASRITLEITNVRVERLQEISSEDAKSEGVLCPIPYPIYCPKGYPEHFQELWESINGEGSWALNPWVWVIEFKRVEGDK